MVRPKNCRLIAQQPDVVYYKPQGIPLRELEEVTLSLDGLEALRLGDVEGMYHEEAAERMGVSRATFGRIIKEARCTVASALLNGKALRIEGGTIQMIEKRKFQCTDCSHAWEVPFGTPKPGACPQCASANLHRVAEEGANSEQGCEAGRRRRKGCGGHGRQNRGRQGGRGRMQAGKSSTE